MSTNTTDDDVFAAYEGPLSDRELLEAALLARRNTIRPGDVERFQKMLDAEGMDADAGSTLDFLAAHGVFEPRNPGETGAADDAPSTPDTTSTSGDITRGLDIDGPDASALMRAIDGPEFEAMGVDWSVPSSDVLDVWDEPDVPIAANPPSFGYTGTTVEMSVSDFKDLQTYIGVELNPFGPEEGAPRDRGEFWAFGRGAIEENVEGIAEALGEGGGEVPMPWVVFGRDGSLRDTQEGRNRALAAERAGLDRLPVRIVYNDEREGADGPLFDLGDSTDVTPGSDGPETGETTPEMGQSTVEAVSGDSGEAIERDVPDPEPGSIMAEIEQEIDQAASAAMGGDDASTRSRDERGGESGVGAINWLAEKNPFDHPGVYIITGHRGSGKTMLAYRAAELIAEREHVLPCTVGLPEHIHDEFPDDWYHVDSVSEAPHEAVLVVDEAYDQFHAREAWDEENISMAGLVNQSRHTGRTIFFITQSTSHLDKTAITEADGLLMKEPGAFHQNFERQQLRTLLSEAEAAFEDLPDDVNPQEFCYVISNSFRGMIRNKLPEFHSVRLSRAYGRGSSGA